MKNFRIFFAVLVLVFVFSACEKMDVKPGCGTPDAQPEAQVADQPVNNRTRNTTVDNGTVISGEVVPDDIVGSGDDDRDGGDKKKTPGR